MDEVLRRDVYQPDLVGPVEQGVRHALAHAHARYLLDDVGVALDVLDVDGRPDGDAPVQELLDVLPALRVPRAGRVGMGQLIDDRDRRMPRDQAVEVELLEDDAPVLDPPQGQQLDPLDEDLRLRSAMGLDRARDDVEALGLGRSGLLQHGIGLPHAGRHPEEYLQLRARARAFHVFRDAREQARPGRAFVRPPCAILLALPTLVQGGPAERRTPGPEF